MVHYAMLKQLRKLVLKYDAGRTKAGRRSRGISAVSRRIKIGPAVLSRKLSGSRPMLLEEAEKIARVCGMKLVLIDDPGRVAGELEPCPTSTAEAESGGPTTPTPDLAGESEPPRE